MTRWKITPMVERARIKKVRRECPEKILEPDQVIAAAIAKFGDKATVSWSGGKCSTVVLYMAIRQRPDISVLFEDTGVEFPETYAFIERIRDTWRLNLQVLKPQTTFWEIVKTYGFPMLRGQYDKRTSLSKDGRPMCCQLLKEEPLIRAGIDCSITGIRAAESRMRMFTIAQRGQIYYAKTLKRWQYHPIALWTEDEVWRYHEEHGLPHNEIYDKGHNRCGCWPCTGYISWKEHLAASHPDLYKFVARLKGEPTLWEYETCPEEVLRREDREAEAIE